MTEPIETTGELVIDGEVMKIAKLVFHPLPKNQCCRTQHANTKKRILTEIRKRLDEPAYLFGAELELQDVCQWIEELELEDAK